MGVEQKGLQDSYSGIRFEPGAHAKWLGDESFADERVVGAIDAHSWPPIVASRMHEYQPQIMAVDGMFQYSQQIDLQGLWWQIPSRPKNINSTGSVLVVSGDPAFFWSGNTEINKLSDEERRKFFSKIDKEVSAMFVPLEYQANQDITSYTSLGGITLGVVTGGLIANAISETRRQHFISRRQFLQFGGAALLSLLTGFSGLESIRAMRRNDAAINSANAQTSEEVERYLKNYGAADQSLLKPNDVDPLRRFRTALLTAKLKDSIDLMNLPVSTSASLVFGNGHVYDNPREMINSEKVNEEIMVSYAQRLLSMLDSVMFDKGVILYPELDRNQLITQIFALIAKTDVFRFIDLKDDEEESFKDKVNDLIHLEKSFQSPRVVRALQKAVDQNS